MFNLFRSQPKAITTRPPSRRRYGRLVSEIVGRVSTRLPVRLATVYKTIDQTMPQYEFFSKVVRGKEAGYELGGLFAKRICEIDAEWVLGRGVSVDTGDDEVDELTNRFLRDNLAILMRWRFEANSLGDSYLIVNPDGTLTLKSPDTCEVLYDDLNVLYGYRFVDQYDKLRITDEYTTTGRTVTIERGAIGMQPRSQRLLVDANSSFASINTQVFSYTNPIAPLIPVVPLHNDKGTNETNGHPLFEGLLKLFARYDDVLNKTLDGVELMGRPVPVVSGVEDPELARQENQTGTEEYIDADGMTQTRPVVDLPDVSMMWLRSGGRLDFAKPDAFGQDSFNGLKILFYLMLEHIGIPEWAWGGAVQSSKASVDAQMPAFIRYLEGRRVQMEAPIIELVSIWLAFQRLVQFLEELEQMLLVWPELIGRDEALVVQKANAAKDRNVVTDETYLRVLDLGIEDPAAEVAAAQAQADTKQEQFDQRMMERDISATDEEDQDDDQNI